MDRTSLVISLLSLVGTGLVALTTYRSAKAATTVHMEANAFQRAQAAEKKADEAEAKVENAVRRCDACIERLRQAEVELVSLESKLRYIVALIHDKYITVEALREEVPANFNTRRRKASS